jgi:hypothetical protein
MFELSPHPSEYRLILRFPKSAIAIDSGVYGAANVMPCKAPPPSIFSMRYD